MLRATLVDARPHRRPRLAYPREPGERRAHRALCARRPRRTGCRRSCKPRLRTLRRDIASLNDFDTHLNDKLQFLLDATLGFINIAQNNVMKVLTVVSVAGIPPVLIAGIYGMNFKIMPELDWAWGYPYGLGR